MTFEALVTKMLNDATFREAVAKDPGTALGSAGVKATPEMVSALKGVNMHSIKRVATAFGKDEVCESGILST